MTNVDLSSCQHQLREVELCNTDYEMVPVNTTRSSCVRIPVVECPTPLTSGCTPLPSHQVCQDIPQFELMLRKKKVDCRRETVCGLEAIQTSKVDKSICGNWLSKAGFIFDRIWPQNLHLNWWANSCELLTNFVQNFLKLKFLWVP